ncbi:MAG TPA: hypothetical protein VH987_11445 [Candidatus Limnocylindria bacterium]|jgi:hypothetical protein
MVASRQTVVWLSWALVVLAVVSGVVLLILASGVLLTPIDIPDFVDRLFEIRRDQERLIPLVILGGVASLGVFLTLALLGVVLRAWAPTTPGRDLMSVLLVLGGVIGIASQLVHMGIHDAGRALICDCGYRVEEVIALDNALFVGESIFGWLLMGALSLVAMGVAVAGRMVAVSGRWRTLSLVIALGLLVAVALRFVAALVLIEAFDPLQVADIIVGVFLAILAPAWAILLLRGIEEPAEVPAPDFG